MHKHLNSKPYNRTINLLASMPFAISILLLLSSVSVIGTLIAQNRSRDYYRSTYGDSWQQFISTVSFDNIYQSWWFISLLGCLFVSLLAAVWRHGIRVINNARALQKIPPPPVNYIATQLSTDSEIINIDKLVQIMHETGFTGPLKESDDGQVKLFMRKGHWGKTGFLPIHLGIMIILAGGFITSQWGYRAAVNITDGSIANKVYIPQGENYKSIELPFEIRNKGFRLDNYNNGMPSEYRSRLDIMQNNLLIAQKEISVNDPLTVDGITIYQASFGDAGSAVSFSITDLSRTDFNIQQLESSVHQTLEEDESGTQFTLTELRQNNVLNLSTNPKQTVMRDLGPSLDLRLQSTIDGTITFRIYKNFPNMIAYTRLGEKSMTTFDLGFSPADQRLVKLLSSYFILLQNNISNTPASKKKALIQAMSNNNIHEYKRKELAPLIENAAKELSLHKLPALFQLHNYQQKLFTGLQVSQDPGANIIWAGSILLVIGLLMFYVSEYRIWLTVNLHSSTSDLDLVLASNRKNSISLHYLLKRLIIKLHSEGFIVKGQIK